MKGPDPTTLEICVNAGVFAIGRVTKVSWDKATTLLRESPAKREAN
jgi:hypothetical protein